MVATSGFNSVSSGFGPRTPPKSGASAQHNGIDIRMPVGTNITTNVPLTFVRSSTQAGGAGNYAVFRDDQGNLHSFLHLDSQPGWSSGQKFNPGDTIAISGNTGVSTGAHLDYRLQDSNGNYIDPLSRDENGYTYAGRFSPEGADKGLGGTDKVGGEITNNNPQNPSGSNTAGQGAAGAGGGGGGAACAGAGLTALAGMAMGGVLGGLGLGLNGAFSGLTNALQQIPGVSALTSAFSQATGMLNSATGALSSLTNGAFGAISGMASNLVPGLTNVIPGVLQGAIGQLTGPLTNIIANPLSLPSAIQQFTASGGLGGFLNQVGNNMVGNFAGGTIGNLVNNLGVSSAFGEINRSIVGGISEAMGQSFGNGLGGAGEMFRNMEGMMTYGLSTLGNNLGAVAANMISTGNFDASQLTRLMAPGAVAQQIIARGLGETTGLTKQLIDNNIPIAGVNSALFDGQVQKILNGINVDSAISAVSQEFGVTTAIDNLGQLTDITKMMPDVASTLPVTSFEGLGQELIKLQVTGAPTLTDLGSAFLKIESGRDLNHISQLDGPIHKPTGELLLKTFGFGSGTYGETTAGDFLGTPAGIVHNDTIPVIIDNISYVHSHPAAQTFYDLIQLLNDTLAGNYTTQGSPGDPGNGIPATPGSIDPPTTGTYTFGSYTSMDDAVYAIVEAVEDEAQVLLNVNDDQLQNAIRQVNMAHTASVAQVMREAHLAELYEINFLEPEKMSPIKAYMFAKSLEAYAERTGKGQIADIIERLATDDIYGDAIKGTMRQARNSRVLEELGVNIERLKIPTGDYYRNPIKYMEDFYLDNLPDQGIYAQPTLFPKTPEDKYVADRDQELLDNGYDLDLTPGQKDEIYYDLPWLDNDPTENRIIGEQILNEVLRRNLLVLGDNVQLINLDRNRINVGKITPDGLLGYDYDGFISALFDLVNKVLYGNIGVTKLSNPFMTDEIVYAIAELLGQVNSTNVDFLQNTYLGGTVLSEVLTKIANKFKDINTVGDTRLDRNDPSTFGGVGPGYNPTIQNT